MLAFADAIILARFVDHAGEPAPRTVVAGVLCRRFGMPVERQSPPA